MPAKPSSFGAKLQGATRGAVGAAVLAAWLSWSCVPAFAAASPAAVPADRENAVLAARAGRLDEGIAGLRALLREQPDDAAVAGDLVVVLRWAERYAEALDAARSLPPDAMPPYVLKAIGDSWLALHRPRQAAEVYRRLVAAQPDDAGARLALFWAEIDAEQFRAAFQIIDEVAAAAGGAEQKLGAERTAAMARAFGDHLAEAQARLERLRSGRPDDPDLLLALSTVYRWRGWPDRALAVTDCVLAGHAGLPGALVSRAWALMDLGRMDEAGGVIHRVTAEHPDDREVPVLERAWRLRHRPELTLETSAGASTGDTLGTRDRQSEIFLHGGLLANRYRPFVHAASDAAEVAEGTLTWQRLGAGMEIAGPCFRLIGEVSGSRFEAGASALGASLDLGWRFGDHWFAGARVDSDSPDVPLRAREHGIDGSSARLGLRWYGSDLLMVRGSFSRVDLSDGNRRQSLLLAADRRLFTGTRFRLTGSAEVYRSANSREDAPYFNPEHDLSWSGALAAETSARRFGERSLIQRLVLSAGIYEQAGFGSAPAGAVRYEHAWRLSRAFSLRYGVGWSSRVYDGGREARRWGYLSTGLRL